MASNDIQRRVSVREKPSVSTESFQTACEQYSQLPESTLFNSVATFNTALELEEAMLEHKN